MINQEDNCRIRIVYLVLCFTRKVKQLKKAFVKLLQGRGRERGGHSVIICFKKNQH